MTQESAKQTLVSGMRPTGSLHLGHYLGVLRNWIRLQNEGQHQCFFFIADWHALTSSYSQTDSLQRNIIEVLKDFLAAGLDPERSTIYIQSAVKEIAELHLLLSMLTPHNWLERDPTLKDLVKAAENNQIKELSYGMLGYPLLQTADILAFKGSVVPVGKDQVAHLEISRQIARRFNNTYGVEFFPEPKAFLTETPTILGVDGQKMSKSYGNDIKLSATEEETFKQVKKMITDPERLRKDDPGNVERCQTVWPYYQIFSESETQEKVKALCHAGERGCMDCKKELLDVINEYLAEMRAKRAGYQDKEMQEILAEGNRKAKAVAKENIEQIKAIMKI